MSVEVPKQSVWNGRAVAAIVTVNGLAGCILDREERDLLIRMLQGEVIDWAAERKRAGVE